MQAIYDKRSYRICIGGDWTANYFGPDQALSVYEEQLQEIGLSLEAISNLPINDKSLQNDIGYKIEDILPYSTLNQLSPTLR